MKGFQVSRSLSQYSSVGEGGHTPCDCDPDPRSVRDYEHYDGAGHPYYPPGAITPAPHQYDSCEECLSTVGGHVAKMHSLDQFERQLPPDGFHTLQYQKSASGAEQRGESPSRIRHLVHSVQRLFAKEYNGTRGGGEQRSGGEEGVGHHYSGHQSRSVKRSKSRERSKSGDGRHESSGRRHRNRTAGWWSSDDNLDSDSSFLVTAGNAGPGGRGGGAWTGGVHGLYHSGPGRRGGWRRGVAGYHGGPGQHSLKRSTWSAMTVSQAREVYPSSVRGGGGGYDKALVPLENKLKERTFHYLQVPSDGVEWAGLGGYPGGGGPDGGGEIPCRRMRSGSYVKAMGDDDSQDSDASPKSSPKTTIIAQREAFRRSVSMDHRSSVNNTPKSHARSRSYTRSLTSSQLGDSLNRQFEAVCETMFGEIESQAVEALDLPGCFRTRSHSYVRAIQAGCSQDDDCLSVFSMTGPSIKGGVGECVCVWYWVYTWYQNPSVICVDSSETLSDSEPDGKALREVHSIGVQVEEDKRRARFKRSNSVTASVQADLDPEGGYPGLTFAVPTQDKSLQYGCSFQKHSSEPESADQYAEYHRTVHTQGQWAYREDYVQDGYATDPHQIPPLPPRAHSPLPLAADRGGWIGTPQPSLEGGLRSLPDSGRASPCLRDGEFFLRLLQTEVERMEGWCQNMEREAEENELPEEVLELIRNAVGSAQMLMTQKVQQFFRLCQQSVDPSAYPQPTSQDLSGLWDLLQLNVEDVKSKFQHLQRLKDSGWRLPPDKKKLPPPLPKNGGVGRAMPVREKSLDLGDRQRTEARRRLLQTKRSSSFRQNSATESADSIEIYIPEAQTRL
uniref:Discs, large (Drosophila) homolog-associated protein 3 n=1 Tax=Oncorhynchus kisutch TaxID=8019 RepID=A0A8C7F4D5_ONCKI